MVLATLPNKFTLRDRCAKLASRVENSLQNGDRWLDKQIAVTTGLYGWHGFLSGPREMGMRLPGGALAPSTPIPAYTSCLAQAHGLAEALGYSRLTLEQAELAGCQQCTLTGRVGVITSVGINAACAVTGAVLKTLALLQFEGE